MSKDDDSDDVTTEEILDSHWSTIRVFVDGQIYNEWVYIQSTNEIQFTIIPEGGSLVEAGYVIKDS